MLKAVAIVLLLGVLSGCLGASDPSTPDHVDNDAPGDDMAGQRESVRAKRESATFLEHRILTWNSTLPGDYVLFFSSESAGPVNCRYDGYYIAGNDTGYQMLHVIDREASDPTFTWTRSNWYDADIRVGPIVYQDPNPAWGVSGPQPLAFEWENDGSVLQMLVVRNTGDPTIDWPKSFAVTMSCTQPVTLRDLAWGDEAEIFAPADPAADGATLEAWVGASGYAVGQTAYSTSYAATMSAEVVRAAVLVAGQQGIIKVAGPNLDRTFTMPSVPDVISSFEYFDGGPGDYEVEISGRGDGPGVFVALLGLHPVADASGLPSGA